MVAEEHHEAGGHDARVTRHGGIHEPHPDERVDGRERPEEGVVDGEAMTREGRDGDEHGEGDQGVRRGWLPPTGAHGGQPEGERDAEQEGERVGLGGDVEADRRSAGPDAVEGRERREGQRDGESARDAATSSRR